MKRERIEGYHSLKSTKTLNKRRLNIPTSFSFRIRSIDIAIGGHSAVAVPIPSLNHPIIYDHDSITWCVRHAGTKPIWKNYLSLVKDNYTFISATVIAVLTVYLFYVFSTREDLRYDIFVCAMKVLQFVIGSPTKIKHKQFEHRIFIALGNLGSVAIITSLTCVYITIIQLKIEEVQLKDRQQLIDNGFQLAGEKTIQTILERDEMVSWSKWFNNDSSMIQQ